MFCLAFYACVATPYAPYHVLIGRLGVIGQEGRSQGTGGPAKLNPFLRFPAFENTIEQAAHKAIATANAVEYPDGTRFHHMPVVAFEHEATPEVIVGAEDFAQGVGEHTGVGEGLLNTQNHFLEAVDFVANGFSARFGTFNAQAELVVFLVANQYVGYRSYFGKDFTQFFFAAFPEGGAVVQVEGYAGAVLFGSAGQFQTEVSGVGRKGRDESRKVHNLHAFLTENAVQIEVLHVERASHFACAVVLNTGTTRAVTAVGNVELVAVAPGVALLHFRAFILHVAVAQVALDELGYGTAFYEGSEYFNRQAQVGSDARYVGLHTGGDDQRPLAVVFKLYAHNYCFLFLQMLQRCKATSLLC